MKNGDFNNIKYLGCFPHDKIPKLFYKEDPKDYLKCIVANNQSHLESGQHWVSIIKDKKGKTIIYDSFYRSNDNPELQFPENWIDPKKNTKIEQSVIEINCGARCIAFLKTVDKFGLNAVLKYL